MFLILYFSFLLLDFSQCQNFPGGSILGGPNWRKDPFIRPKYFGSEEKVPENASNEPEKLLEDQIKTPEIQKVEKIKPVPEKLPEKQDLQSSENEELPRSEEEFEKIPDELPEDHQLPNIIPRLPVRGIDPALDDLPLEFNQNLGQEAEQPLPELPLTINGLTLLPPLPPLIPDSAKNGTDQKIPEPSSNVIPFNGQLRCQDPDTHEFIPTAMACKDTRGADLCTQIFQAPDPKTGRRDPKCDQKGFEDIATTCRHTCGICCEDLAYACEDDTSGIIDCSKQVEKCNNPKWFNTLAKYCAGTCGLCTKTSCRDQQVDCRILKGVCNIEEHKEQMKKNCARTCGFCLVEEALPVGPEPGTKPEENTGSGGTGDINADCIDTNPRCDVWARKGFCRNNFYLLTYKKEQCAKTCELC